MLVLLPVFLPDKSWFVLDVAAFPVSCNYSLCHPNANYNTYPWYKWYNLAHVIFHYVYRPMEVCWWVFSFNATHDFEDRDVELEAVHFSLVLISVIFDAETHRPFTVADFPRVSCDHEEQLDLLFKNPEAKLRGPRAIMLFPPFKTGKHKFDSDYNLADKSERAWYVLELHKTLH